MATPAAAPTLAQQVAATAAGTQKVDYSAQLAVEAQDIQNNNFTGAWNIADSESNAQNTTDSKATGNPLVAALETSAGLQQLDPGKTWTQAEMTQFYNAAMTPTNWNATTTLGQNPEGGKTLWGSNAAGKAASDAQTNFTTSGDNSAPDLARFAAQQPSQSFGSKYGMDIAALVATVATMGAASPLLAAAVGAGTLIAGNAAAGNATTWGSVGKDVAGGALSAAAPALGGAINGATGIGAAASGALAGAGVGAARSALTGGNIGIGAAMGGVAGGVQGAYQQSGLSQGISNSVGGGSVGNAAAGLVGGVGSKLAAGAVGSALAGSNGGGTASGSQGMADSSGGAIQTGIGLGTTLLGTIGNVQNANTAGNVLSLANAGTGVGTNYGYSGPNGTSSTANGQVSTGLSGGLNLANTNLGNFANTASSNANSITGVPSNVQNAINQQAGSLSQTPQSTNGMLGQQYNAQTGVQGSEAGLINSGTQQLNNPLTGQYQTAASNQLATAGQDFNTTYQNSLSSLNQALALPTAQAESQMADAQFGRGQLGTSGGALQTQAFATGLGQAYLGNQQTAYNEAMNAQNSATSNAATLGGAANTNLNTANSLLANAYGQFNNTSSLGTNTANSIFGQNSTISQLGNQYGQQNVGNQVTAASLPGSLQGQQITNANSAISGTTALNNTALSGFNASLAAGTQQGQQYNSAIGNSAKLAAPLTSQYGTNGLASIGAGISSALGSNGVGSALGSALGGSSGSTNLNYDTSTVDNGNYYTGGNDLLDMSNLNIAPSSPSYDYTEGSGYYG